jgi:hypothetical protein
VYSTNYPKIDGKGRNIAIVARENRATFYVTKMIAIFNCKKTLRHLAAFVRHLLASATFSSVAIYNGATLITYFEEEKKT